MVKQAGHDGPTPPNWPSNVIYLTRSRLATSFPAQLLPLLFNPPSTAKFAPRPIPHPSYLSIKTITTTGHPANGQSGLFTKKKIQGGEMIVPYLGVIHVTMTPIDPDKTSVQDEHSESDYDLSLLRLSASDVRNPFPDYHISIGLDAATCGNCARFVNDYRGVATLPNAEFRLGKGEGGELRMEIWSLKQGVQKGEEILVSYGKGWWGARKG